MISDELICPLNLYCLGLLPKPTQLQLWFAQSLPYVCIPKLHANNLYQFGTGLHLVCIACWVQGPCCILLVGHWFLIILIGMLALMFWLTCIMLVGPWQEVDQKSRRVFLDFRTWWGLEAFSCYECKRLYFFRFVRRFFSVDGIYLTLRQQVSESQLVMYVSEDDHPYFN